jgi:hypothetical protein
VGVARGVGPKEWVWGVAGAALLIVVQMTARAHTLTEQDAINLVNGLEDFNPALHQPHPPGYLLVVLAGHALSWLGNSLDALLGVALVASVIALIATYLLGRAMFGRSAGLVAATLLAATPLFLYYLNIASVYPTETAAAPIIGLIGYRVATRASDAWALALLPVLAVAGGFRPTVIALMLPLCAVAVWLGRPRPRPVLLGAAAAVAIVIAWAIPTISQSGGWDMYSEESSGLYGRAAGHTSLFYGASRLEAITNVEWSLGALLMVSVPAFVLLSLLAATNRSLPTPPRNLPAWSILAAWALPYIAFNALVLFGKPGYVMAIVPAIHVAAGGLARSYRRPQAAAIAVLAAMLLVFYTVPNLSLPRRLPAFFPTANSIDVADVEARGLQRVAPTCLPPRCTLFSLPQSDQWWARDPRDIATEYAPGSTIVRIYDYEDADISRKSEILWVGELVPEAVKRNAELEETFGPWSVYRSQPHQTARILKGGVSAEGQ